MAALKEKEKLNRGGRGGIFQHLQPLMFAAAGKPTSPPEAADPFFKKKNPVKTAERVELPQSSSPTSQQSQTFVLLHQVLFPWSSFLSVKLCIAELTDVKMVTGKKKH